MSVTIYNIIWRFELLKLLLDFVISQNKQDDNE